MIKKVDEKNINKKNFEIIKIQKYDRFINDDEGIIDEKIQEINKTKKSFQKNPSI